MIERIYISTGLTASRAHQGGKLDKYLSYVVLDVLWMLHEFMVTSQIKVERKAYMR